MFTEKVIKIALSVNDGKIIQSIDSIETIAYGTCIDLICKKELINVELSPSKKMCVLCFIESPLKLVKNASYFILKGFSVLKIFKFLS